MADGPPVLPQPAMRIAFDALAVPGGLHVERVEIEWAAQPTIGEVRETLAALLSAVSPGDQR